MDSEKEIPLRKRLRSCSVENPQKKKQELNAAAKSNSALFEPDVLNRINSWRVHHVRERFVDVAQNEASHNEKLLAMSEHLKQFEQQHPELEDTNKLIKNMMQRQNAIADGVNQAEKSMMQILDHEKNVIKVVERANTKRGGKPSKANTKH